MRRRRLHRARAPAATRGGDAIAIRNTEPSQLIRRTQHEANIQAGRLRIVSVIVRDPMAPDGPSATAVMRPASGSQAHGTVKFTQVGTRVRVDAEIAGALRPEQHGIHIHEKGDCTCAGCSERGRAFQSGRQEARRPGFERAPRRATLAICSANEYGKATLSVMVDGISVGKGPNGVIGKGVIVHADPDDLKTDPAGNSGDRIACGVVEG